MKITFITYHNWETKRIGGFHKLAEAALKAGHEVVFFSFPRPYYIRWKKDERLNNEVLNKLSKGKYYKIENNQILNITFPTLSVPGFLRHLLPTKLIYRLELTSFKSFRKFYDSYLKNTDVFVYESCGAIYLFDDLKRIAPDAKHVYRPSDPLMIDGCSNLDKFLETKILLESDYNFIVNQAGANLYRSNIKCFDKVVNYTILPNGVDTSKFNAKYACPKCLERGRTALYVGVIGVEWGLVIMSAKRLPDINFVIVCPNTVPPEEINGYGNITFIKGITPDEVPAYVTNCDVIIVPNPNGMYLKRPWGITAKYYQAMTAKKPIVAFSDTKELEEYHISVAYNYNDFVLFLRRTIDGPLSIEYEYHPLDWEEVGQRFLDDLADKI